MLRTRVKRQASLVVGLALLCACSPQTHSSDVLLPGELAFVRGGILEGRSNELAGSDSPEATQHDSESTKSLGSYLLHPAEWTPGGRLEGPAAALASRATPAALGPGSPASQFHAPLQAECLPVFSVSLGDVSRLVSLGGTAPDTALAWSPDGRLLAVGTYLGDLLVLDGWSGQVLVRRRLAETMVKTLVWGAEGDILYAGEQSPDAYVHALDPSNLESRWRIRLADEVGSSPAPDAEDLYGVYTLPSAADMALGQDGSLLVAATHAWNDDSGVRRNQSRLLQLGDDGSRLAAWPSTGPAEVTISRFRLDREGGLLALTVGGSSREALRDGIPRGGVQVLRAEGLEPVASFVPEPLRPHYDSTFIWDALDVDAAAGKVLAGLADGRTYLWDLAGGPVRLIDVATPLLAAGVPIAASVGFGFFNGDEVVLATSGTTVPYGSSAAAARPPSAHPSENRVFRYDLRGTPLSVWSGDIELNGLVAGARPGSTLVGGGSRKADDRRDAFGLLAFESPSAEPTFCATEGPVFFRFADTDDGRIAVTEYPFLQPDGTQAGAYRVTVLR